MPNSPAYRYHFEPSAHSDAIFCLERLRRYTDGYTGYDGTWRAQ